MAILERLRGAMQRWIEESNDQGRIPEPPGVTARQGLTKPGPGGNPSQPAIIDESENLQKINASSPLKKQPPT